MKSIFNPAYNAEFVERINKLTPSTPALWGKMNATQMVAHSQLTFQLSLGELKLKRAFIGRIFGNIAKRKILNEQPLDKGLPTLKEALINDQRNFEKEKENLKALVTRARDIDPEDLTKYLHPFFGELSAKEWGILNTKHLDHHLRQFGV